VIPSGATPGIPAANKLPGTDSPDFAFITGDDQLDGGDGTDDLDGEAGTDTCVNGETVANCEA
jgi:Ca2+-binding RTX toxin-like protein